MWLLTKLPHEEGHCIIIGHFRARIWYAGIPKMNTWQPLNVWKCDNGSRRCAEMGFWCSKMRHSALKLYTFLQKSPFLTNFDKFVNLKMGRPQSWNAIHGFLIKLYAACSILLLWCFVDKTSSFHKNNCPRGVIFLGKRDYLCWLRVTGNRPTPQSEGICRELAVLDIRVSSDHSSTLFATGIEGRGA